MLRNITREKVEEVIELAERAHDYPVERADMARRGGADGRRAVSRPDQPLSPQPAPDWQHALPRYLDDLSDAALDELAALYKMGHGEASDPRQAMAAPSRTDAPPHGERAHQLATLPDLPDSLRAALRQL